MDIGLSNVLLENVRPANVFASCFISFRRRRSRTKSTPVSVSCSGAVSCNAFTAFLTCPAASLLSL